MGGTTLLTVLVVVSRIGLGVVFVFSIPKNFENRDAAADQADENIPSAEPVEVVVVGVLDEGTTLVPVIGVLEVVEVDDEEKEGTTLLLFDNKLPGDDDNIEE